MLFLQSHLGLPLDWPKIVSEVLSTHRNGKPHLLIRIGNTRGNFLLHPEVWTFAHYSRAYCMLDWARSPLIFQHHGHRRFRRCRW